MTVEIVKKNYIKVEPLTIKRSNAFTCIGWISNINIPDENPFILLAVSDIYGEVESDKAIKIELIREVNDYRMQFFNSKSKLILKSIGISLDDKKWHFLSYVCTGEGIMHYYVDGIECPCEEGVNEFNIPYNIAWSRYGRLGSGNVWVPYLYRDWQSVRMYRWRYASNLILHKEWLQEIYEKERELLV
jgi:hypothetical protein